ncbi:MAG: hypothetical protein Q8P24_19735 [Desulfobacterales bacterium]|nr:hypothetical protein [Desulfobacterales bacterium]
MKNTRDNPPEDDFEIRCPRLGHEISFSYCRSENKGLPCFKTLDCWHTYFKVEFFFSNRLTPEQMEQIFQKQTKPKILSLMELIEQAKKTKKKQS